MIQTDIKRKQSKQFFVLIFKKMFYFQRLKYNNDQLQIQLHKKILQTRNLIGVALETFCS